MARNLDPQIMSDPWFIELDDRARLGWIMLILHGADDQGRFLLNGRLMKSMLFPADDLPAAEVLAMLEGFARAGKIHAYEIDGARYGQIVKWWKFQIGAEWMAPSRHPAPQGWADRWRIHAKGGKGIIDTSPAWSDKQNCGFIDQDQDQAAGPGAGSGSGSGNGLPSGEVKVKGEDKDEGEGGLDDEENPAAAASCESPFTVYEQNIGPLSAAVSERIRLAEAEYGCAWLLQAIRLAALRNKPRWDYVEGILRSWQRDGKDDGEKADKTYAQALVEAGYSLPQQVPAGWLT